MQIHVLTDHDCCCIPFRILNKETEVDDLKLQCSRLEAKADELTATNQVLSEKLFKLKLFATLLKEMRIKITVADKLLW